MGLAIAIISAWLASTFALWVMLRSTQRVGMVRPNYTGTSIPVGVGAAFPVGLAVGSIATLLVYDLPAVYLLPSVAVVLFGVLGLIDDRWGDRTIGGFAGHLGAMLKGKLTTGAFKAIGGGIVALVFAFTVIPLLDPGRSSAHLLFDAGLIALSANTFNLFDLRPARAQKVFLILLVALVGLSVTPLADQIVAEKSMSFWLVSIAAVTPLFLGDLRGRFMLGDSGSNALGAAFGVGIAGTVGTWGLILVVTSMLFIQWYGEARSISKLIEATPGLRHLDELGRKQ